MTLTTWFLLMLAIAAAIGCIAAWAPWPPPEPHPWETDPFELADERPGRHRMAGEDTQRLGDSHPRAIE